MCGTAGLVISVFETAFLNALANVASCTWCRLMIPLRGSLESCRDGKTYCQPMSRAALGYFLASAEFDFTINPLGGIARNAQNEEREKFSTFVRELDRTVVWNFDALPYQRVLSDDETSTVWTKLQRWGVKRNDYWYPLVPTEITGLIAFNSDAFDAAVPSRASSKILASKDIARVWEMRESGPSYIQGIACIDTICNGAEGYWTSCDVDWLIYASHEMTITIGGWMLEAVKSIWPNWNQHKFNLLS